MQFIENFCQILLLKVLSAFQYISPSPTDVAVAAVGFAYTVATL